MAKTGTLNLRVNTEDKQAAEAILKKLGLSMSTAVTLYLKQIVLNQGIPFEISLSPASKDLSLSRMSPEEFKKMLAEAYKSSDTDELIEASDFFQQFKKEHEWPI